MNHLTESKKQIHNNIDEIAKFEIDLIESKSDALRKKNEIASNKLIVQSQNIIQKHYGC